MLIPHIYKKRVDKNVEKENCFVLPYTHRYKSQVRLFCYEIDMAKLFKRIYILTICITQNMALVKQLHVWSSHITHLSFMEKTQVTAFLYQNSSPVSVLQLLHISLTAFFFSRQKWTFRGRHKICLKPIIISKFRRLLFINSLFGLQK